MENTCFSCAYFEQGKDDSGWCRYYKKKTKRDSRCCWLCPHSDYNNSHKWCDLLLLHTVPSDYCNTISIKKE